MKNFIRISTALGLSLTLTACVGGSDVPTKGRMIDQVHPHASYPQVPTTQAQLSPANNNISGVLRAPDITAYPQGIVDRLLASWTGPRPEARVWLVPENAFTSDVSVGGAIFLNTGLIQYFHNNQDIQKEDALAFVLAHELSHILLGHTAAQRSNKATKNYAFSAMKWGTVIGRAAAGAGAAGSAGTALLSSMGAKIFTDTAIFPSWSRGQEEQADALAIDLMARAGYSISAASDVMDVLVSEDEQDEQKAATQEKTGGKSFTQDNFTLKANADDAIGSALVDGLNTVAQQHPHSKERRNALAAYLRQAYPVRTHVTLARAPLQAWVNSRPVITLLSQIDLLDKASDAVTSKQWSNAKQFLSRIGRPVNNSEYYAFLAYETAAATGQKQLAVSILSTAAQRDDVTFQIATEWGMQLSAAGRTENAEKYMATEQEAMGNTGFLPYRISNALKGKDSITAAKLMAQCAASGEDALENQCAVAGKNQ